MYQFSVRFDDERRSLILTSGEFLTHRIKAQGVKITNNLPPEYILNITFAPLNDNDYVVERSFTNRALNMSKELFVDLNFGDDSTGEFCRNGIIQHETVICFNNVSDQYTGEFMLIANKVNEVWENQMITDEDAEFIKNNVIIEPTEDFHYKGFYCRAIYDPDDSSIDEDFDNNDIGMALLPPTDDPEKSMSFIYRVPPNKTLRVCPDEEYYDKRVDFVVFEGDDLVGYNGMIEDEEHFRYCLPMWSPLLLRFLCCDNDWNPTRLSPSAPITVDHVENLGPYLGIYTNFSSTTKGVVVLLPKYGYKLELIDASN